MNKKKKTDNAEPELNIFDDFAGFEIDDLNFNLDLSFDGLQFEDRYMKPPKTPRIPEHHLQYANAEKLAQDIQMHPGARYFVLVAGSFWFGDFIEALIVRHNWHIKKMTVSTLSLNQNNIDSLANLLLGDYVQELNLIISDYFYSHERNNLIPYIYQELDINNQFQLTVAGSHCKTCIFETHDSKFIVIHGSANLRSSGNIEQICIEENKGLYLFNDLWQSQIVEHYKTIDKPIRNKKLWQILEKTPARTQRREAEKASPAAAATE